MKTSFKTTIGGVLMAAGAFLQTIQDPSWVAVVGTVLVGVGGLLTGASARDNNVTSEEAGAE